MPQQARERAPARTMAARINEQTNHQTTSEPLARSGRHSSTTLAPLSLTTLCLALALACALLLAAPPGGGGGRLAAAAAAEDDFGSPFGRFAFESLASADFGTAPPAAGGAFNRSTGAPFVWQPLPLRATFRPLNRAAAAAAAEQPVAAPRAPRPPRQPQAPRAPLALSISERSISAESPFNDNAPSGRFNGGGGGGGGGGSSFFQPPAGFDSTFAEAPAPTTITTTTTTTTTPAPASARGDLDDDELPTRQPMTRFRPTRGPAADEDATPASARGESLFGGGSGALIEPTANANASGGRMSQECFECICEASTNCNAQSRCQTSDVRHTRCGLFLISYDQWLASGLSRELVSREALARDAAADERAFYECVTQRDCAQRLLAIYMARHRKDCDRDGRVDCYDLAAIHHSGMEQCASESLLDSQYWSDFSACLGFGRRRRRR